jgi:hypothetical protein
MAAGSDRVPRRSSLIVRQDGREMRVQERLASAALVGGVVRGRSPLAGGSLGWQRGIRLLHLVAARLLHSYRK